MPKMNPQAMVSVLTEKYGYTQEKLCKECAKRGVPTTQGNMSAISRGREPRWELGEAIRKIYEKATGKATA